MALLLDGAWEAAEAEQRKLVEGLSRVPGDRSKDPGDLSAAQNNLAVLLSRLSRHGEAETLLGRATAQRTRLFGEADPRTGRLLRNLAAVQWRGGSLSRAQETLSGGAAMPARGVPPTGSGPAGGGGSRSLESSGGGPKGAGRKPSASLLLWLGALYQEMDPAGTRTEATLRKALRLSDDTDPLFPEEGEETAALCREQLAQLLRDEGHLDEAASLLQEALAARRRALSPSDPLVLRDVYRLAAVQQQRGQKSAAEQLMVKALYPLGLAGPAVPDPGLLLLQGQLGALWIQPQTRPQALLAGPAMDVTASGQGLHLLAQALSGLARYGHHVLIGPPAPAEDFLRAGIQTATSALSGTLLGRSAVMELPQEVTHALLRATDAPELLLRLQEQMLPAPRPKEAPPSPLELLLRQRADRLLQPPYDHPARPPAPQPADIQRLDQLIVKAEQEAALADPRLRELLALRDADLGQVEQALGRDHATLLYFLRGLLRPGPLSAPEGSVPQLSRKGVPLPPLRLLIDLPQAPPDRRTLNGTGTGKGTRPEVSEHYLALIVEARQKARLIDLGDVARVDALVDKLSRQAEAGKDLKEEMQKLGEALILPLASFLPEKGRLYLRPTPELAGVPWSALPLVDGQLLCSRGAVTLLDTAAALLHRSPGSEGTAHRPLQPILLLGAPLLRDAPTYPPPFSALRSIPPLPGAGELIDLSHLLRQHRYDPRGAPVIGLAATKTRFSAWLPARVIHVLAPLVIGPMGTDVPLPLHPFRFPLSELSPARGLPMPVRSRASVALAGYVHPSSPSPTAQQIYEPGLLSPEELGRLDLHDTALFVFSGPMLPSSRGAGAGLVALRSAAHRAGAQGVLMTLWRPPDPVARQLMLDVYQAWLHSGDATEAVRSVQLSSQQKGLPPLHYAGLSASTR